MLEFRAGNIELYGSTIDVGAPKDPDTLKEGDDDIEGVRLLPSDIKLILKYIDEDVIVGG